MRIAVALVMALLAAGCGSAPPGSTSPGSAGPATALPSTSSAQPSGPVAVPSSEGPTRSEGPRLPAPSTLGDRLVATVGGLAHPCAMATDGASVWVTDQTPDALVRIDPKTNTVVERFPGQGSPCGLAVGPKGRIWVARYAAGAVVEFDPTRGTTRSTVSGFGEIWDLKVGFGAVWITDRGGHQLVRIDPATAKVVARIAIGSLPSGIAIAAGSVWVGDDADRAVIRVDPKTNRIVATIPVERPLQWFANDADRVIGADRIQGTIEAMDVNGNAQGPAITGFGQPLDGTVAFGRAWIPDGARRTLTELDAASLAVVRVDDLAGTSMPFVVESGFGSVWVLDYGGTSLLRIRP